MDQVLTAVNATRGTLLAHRLEWAGTSETRRRGLLGRDGLAPGDGLYLVPCPWIHTFGMRFAIDVAFLAADGRVVSVHEALAPNRLSRLVLRAEGVLELPAGTLAETGTRRGDRVRFEAAETPASPQVSS